MRVATLAIALLCSLPALAPAANDESLAAYLREPGLTAAECIERSPRDLMGWIAEREKVGYTGTTGYEQAVIERFYASYRTALRPEIDARYPNARKLREPLLKLLCFIHDFMAAVNGSRTYVTDDRIAAYTEHLLGELYRSAGGTLTIAADSHPSTADVVTFARLKAALWADIARERPKFDPYSTELLDHLKAVEAADPSIKAFNLRYYIIDFIDRYISLLNPNSLEVR